MDSEGLHLYAQFLRRAASHVWYRVVGTLTMEIGPRQGVDVVSERVLVRSFPRADKERLSTVLVGHFVAVLIHVVC